MALGVAGAGAGTIRNLIKVSGIVGAAVTGFEFLQGRPAQARGVSDFDFSDQYVLQDLANASPAHRNAAATNPRTQDSLCQNSCQDQSFMNARLQSLSEFSSLSGCEPGSSGFSYQARNGTDYNFQISLNSARQVERIDFENLPGSTAARTYHVELENGELKRVCHHTGRQNRTRSQCQSIESVMRQVSGPRLLGAQALELRRIIASYHQMKLFLPGVSSCCNEEACSTELNRAITSRSSTRPGRSGGDTGNRSSRGINR